ncbi:MAG: CDP-glycerol glycerophosphotransferase family protein [Oscillospiraceae bacterium]|nr:CDP-glycerol glycerophosphotransferase family protein [Oscillospiraceae bacterium]
MKLVSNVIRGLFRLLPLKKRVLFYTVRADGRLRENLQCVYDEVHADKVIFAKMLPHSGPDKLRQYALLLTSKVVVTDDYLRYLRSVRLRPAQKLVQVWHGVGVFKKSALDVPSKLTRQEEIDTHAQYDAFIVAAEGNRRIYADAFGVDVGRVLALGVPRTDLLVNGESRERLCERFFESRPQLRGKKIYAYLPTFREEKGERVPFDPKIDWNALDAALTDDEAFVIHRHPVMSEVFLTGKYVRLFDLGSCPTSELLAAMDVLVTDYSSVMVEASMLLTPTVFYCPDFDSYERGFYISYPDELPGEVVYRGGELLGVIRETAANPPVERIKKFRRWQTEACDGSSSKRVATLVDEYLNS